MLLPSRRRMKRRMNSKAMQAMLVGIDGAARVTCTVSPSSKQPDWVMLAPNTNRHHSMLETRPISKRQRHEKHWKRSVRRLEGELRHTGVPVRIQYTVAESSSSMARSYLAASPIFYYLENQDVENVLKERPTNNPSERCCVPPSLPRTRVDLESRVGLNKLKSPIRELEVMVFVKIFSGYHE